jgi:hypothetical protein
LNPYGVDDYGIFKILPPCGVDGYGIFKILTPYNVDDYGIFKIENAHILVQDKYRIPDRCVGSKKWMVKNVISVQMCRGSKY